MFRFFNPYLFVSLLVLTSCAALRAHSFTSDNIRPGMTKEQVILQFGKPDRESFIKSENDILYETLYYTEFESKGVVPYYDYILDFKNGTLMAMRHEPQIPPSEKTITIKKE